MMPVLFAVGNYYFIGTEYFTNPETFLIATPIVFLLYWFSVILLTILIRGIINRYPRIDQTTKRLVVMLLTVGAVTVALAVFDVWIYSITPGLEVAFTWQNIWPIIILGEFFDLFLCAMLGLFYSLEQWRKNEAETEKLQRLSLQSQFDALKGQVNPHFLFNSLNTLSSLIGEDQEVAEQFVEDLAKVYRYILQAGKIELIPLRSEVHFMQTYKRLLDVRYGESLQISLPESVPAELHVPPLSLQVLVDNAIKHNAMSGAKPLTINIETAFSQRISISNNVHPKIRAIGTTRAGLASVKAKYRELGNREVRVEQTDENFKVSLPLLPEPVRV
ncbi:histidine kinase [Dyadobacter luticola]|uniref:Histidine kinase n=2 Tax=Dyadobacter luticola TaxID=1979387 RepID=A0A5R9L6K2_9BACT|nr:histidine kinase [Dyadobacter luticola]